MMLITAACVIHPSIFPSVVENKNLITNNPNNSLQCNTVRYSMGGVKALSYVTLVDILQEVGSDGVIYSRRGDLSELDWKIFRPV